MLQRSHRGLVIVLTSGIAACGASPVATDEATRSRPAASTASARAEAKGQPPVVDASREKEPTRRFPLAEVERIDCRTKGAPAWCRQIRYATDAERAGTLVAIIRSANVGEPRWCSDGKYMGNVFPTTLAASTLKKLAAVAVTLEPSDRDGAARERYFLVPPGAEISDLEWMGPCPVE